MKEMIQACDAIRHDVPSTLVRSEPQDGSLIWINPRDADVPFGTVSIPQGALNALVQIRNHLGA